MDSNKRACLGKPSNYGLIQKEVTSLLILKH